MEDGTRNPMIVVTIFFSDRKLKLPGSTFDAFPGTWMYERVRNSNFKHPSVIHFEDTISLPVFQEVVLPFYDISRPWECPLTSLNVKSDFKIGDFNPPHEKLPNILSIMSESVVDEFPLDSESVVITKVEINRVLKFLLLPTPFDPKWTFETFSTSDDHALLARAMHSLKAYTEQLALYSYAFHERIKLSEKVQEKKVYGICIPDLLKNDVEAHFRIEELAEQAVARTLDDANGIIEEVDPDFGYVDDFHEYPEKGHKFFTTAYNMVLNACRASEVKFNEPAAEKLIKGLVQMFGIENLFFKRFDYYVQHHESCCRSCEYNRRGRIVPPKKISGKWYSRKHDADNELGNPDSLEPTNCRTFKMDDLKNVPIEVLKCDVLDGNMPDGSLDLSKIGIYIVDVVAYPEGSWTQWIEDCECQAIVSVFPVMGLVMLDPSSQALI